MKKIEPKKHNFKLSLKKWGVPGYFLSSNDQVLIKIYRKNVLNLIMIIRKFRSSTNIKKIICDHNSTDIDFKSFK
jgi:hypothetical protein